MRVVLLIDTLNSGGAQRQIVNLAILLKRRNIDVQLIYYYAFDHFKYMLEEAEVKHEVLLAKGVPQRVYKIRKFLNQARPDVVLCFLDIPSILGIFASLPFRSWKLITSERFLEIKEPGKIKSLLRLLYPLVDAITVNSFSNEKAISERSAAASVKATTIYNCVDLNTFKPRPDFKTHKGTIRLMVVAGFRAEKNPHGLLESIAYLRKEYPSLEVCLDWYGHKNTLVGEESSSVFSATMKQREELELEDYVRHFDPVQDIHNYYPKYDALVLPSFSEGVPNVVCEAMACGLPILMSDVADAQHLVSQGVNGFLFDPSSLKDMSSAIYAFCCLSESERTNMSKKSIEKARDLFSPDKHVDSYINLFQSLLKGE